MQHTDTDQFLNETHFCDFSHPEIKKVADVFKLKFKEKNKIAYELFYFVRDSIQYSVGNWNKKASKTLLFKYGTCTNKTNLLVALCRACSIPAGYGVMNVVGTYYFGPIAPKKLTSHVSKKSKHVYTFIYLDNKWIHCDPSDDKQLSLNTQHINPQSKLVDWDGFSDAPLNLSSEHILDNSGPIANIDDIILKKQRKRLFLPVRIGNRYISFLRKHGVNVSRVEELEDVFIKWLKKNHFLDFIFYSLFGKK